MTKRPHQPLAIIVGANICAFRQKIGMSQAELARQLDVSPDQISRIERGNVAPRFNRIEKICEILDCSPAELFISAEDLGKLQEPMTQEGEALYLAERLVKILRRPLKCECERKDTTQRPQVRKVRKVLLRHK